jgi:hypothetical protein
MPKLKWITSHFPSPSHTSSFFSPLEVGPQLSGARWTFALPASAFRTAIV